MCNEAAKLQDIPTRFEARIQTCRDHNSPRRANAETPMLGFWIAVKIMSVLRLPQTGTHGRLVPRLMELPIRGKDTQAT